MTMVSTVSVEAQTPLAPREESCRAFTMSPAPHAFCRRKKCRRSDYIEHHSVSARHPHTRIAEIVKRARRHAVFLMSVSYSISAGGDAPLRLCIYSSRGSRCRVPRRLPPHVVLRGEEPRREECVRILVAVCAEPQPQAFPPPARPSASRPAAGERTKCRYA